ncbi:flagellar motor switch protein FliM [uncultured Tyzzerella sp.]|uniref:flagellar motor switch protein FliM n=1 Tax=uncultured Tyzzerella sp. TaxID=2321398 RepID=UPI0029431FBE|nr:flagellar motor switch protein FliM [uncultured Tyzzerella sp.]
MSEILSQEEIDNLLNAMASGDDVIEQAPVNEKKVSIYDFARPSKFGKEQLRTLEIIFDNFARVSSSFLTGYLRTTTTIEVVSSEQVTYGEFNNSLLNPIVLNIIDFNPFKGSIILDLSATIGYSMIDRILGGTGETISKTRDFTEIEVTLLTKIMENVVSRLEEPWKQVCEVHPRLERLETNSQFAQIMSPNEMVALVTLSIKVGDVEGLMNFCIPYIVIEPIVGNLNTKHWFSSVDENNDGQYRPFVEKHLEEARIPVSVVVGKTNITVDEFINIQVGDVIPLDSYVTSDFKVKVGELTKFYAKPGVNKGKNAIQITSIIRKGE